MATYQYLALPIPVAADPGAVVDIETILSGAFGSNYGGYSDYVLSYYGPHQLSAWDFSYWNVSAPSVARWFVNGSDIGGEHQTDVPLAQLASADLHVGNDIGPLALITVPTAGTPGHWTAYAQYALITVAPSLMSPTAGQGEPTTADIVASAHRFAAAYVDVPNDNDCHHIAEAVVGAAGATLPYLSYDTDPTQNQDGGFWRIVYRGSDPDPVAHWQTLVQPGDIVRMAWTAGDEHTTLVLSLNSDGTMQVYDNIAYDSSHTEIIGIHTANYDPDTIPTSITIYRLTPDHLYLVNGTDQGETVAGTVQSDLVVAGGGDDRVKGGAGDDTLRGGAGADILDGGDGQDTADYSDASAGVVVDLSPASFGWFGRFYGWSDPLAEAFGVVWRSAGWSWGSDDGRCSLGRGGGTGFGSDATGDRLLSIENVVGSAFDDKLTGSSLANRLDGGDGADVLNGRAGDDTLIGGAGDDRFVFACGDGRDVVADFVAGDGSGDVIDLRGYGITSFAELDARMSQVGSDVVIVLDADDRITLQNVSEGSLNAADFAFASASPFAGWLRLLEGEWGIGWVFGSPPADAGMAGQGAIEVPGGMLNEITPLDAAWQRGSSLPPGLAEFMLV